jgi:hypothetical protein
MEYRFPFEVCNAPHVAKAGGLQSQGVIATLGYRCMQPDINRGPGDPGWLFYLFDILLPSGPDCLEIQLEGAAAAFALHIVLIAFAFPQVDLLAEATGAFHFEQFLLHFALEV